MTLRVIDQAEGLRRLLSPTPTRVVALAAVGCGEGVTTAAMGLAAALVLQGRDVLLVDEQPARSGSAGAVWALEGLGAPGDPVPARAGCGVDVVALAPGRQDADGAEPFAPRAHCPGGVVLVDAALDADGRLSPLAQQADELLLVLRPQPASITAAYAGIKRLHYAHGLRQLRFLVNGVAGAGEAQPIMDNLAATGSRYLAVSLQAAGWVRADAHLDDARRLGRTVVEAFPASPAALDLRRLAADVLRWPSHSPAPARRPGAAPLPARHAAYGLAA